MSYQIHDVATRVVVNIFRVKKHILGKVDLQKSIYFMKRFGIDVPFEFRWNILGPYSYELARHSLYMESEGILNYRGTYEIDEEIAKEYAMRLETEAVRDLSNFFEDIDVICEDKGFDKVRFIECLASLDFLRENVTKIKKDKESILRLLSWRKPDKMEIFKRMIDDAWNLLDKYFG